MRRSHGPTQFEKTSPSTRSVTALLLLMIPSWSLTACKPSDEPTSFGALFGQFTRIGPLAWYGYTALVNKLKQTPNGQYILTRKTSHGSFCMRCNIWPISQHRPARIQRTATRDFRVGPHTLRFPRYTLPTWASLRLIIGIFGRHLLSSVSYKYCYFIGSSFPLQEPSAHHAIQCRPLYNGRSTRLHWPKNCVHFYSTRRKR